MSRFTFPPLSVSAAVSRHGVGKRLGGQTRIGHIMSCSAMTTGSGGRRRGEGGWFPRWPLLVDWPGIGLLVEGGE